MYKMWWRAGEGVGRVGECSGWSEWVVGNAAGGCACVGVGRYGAC